MLGHRERFCAMDTNAAMLSSQLDALAPDPINVRDEVRTYNNIIENFRGGLISFEAFNAKLAVLRASTNGNMT
jgi:hypothetical protein